jgi:hypothetical protein
MLDKEEMDLKLRSSRDSSEVKERNAESKIEGKKPEFPVDKLRCFSWGEARNVVSIEVTQSVLCDAV